MIDMENKKPVHPCKKDCEYRSANCHNETCPFGWAEYEQEKKEIESAKTKDFVSGVSISTLTAAGKSGARKKFLSRKRENKF